MKAWGSAYVVVAALSGYESLFAMADSVNGATGRWWPPVTLAAAILLFIDGLKLLLPRLPSVWLTAFAGAVPLAICSLFGEWPIRVWVFSAALMLIEGVLLKARSTTKREGIAALAGLLVLNIALADSTLRVARYYWQGWWDATSRWTLFQIIVFVLPVLIPWSILLLLLAHSARVVFGGLRQTADAGK